MEGGGGGKLRDGGRELEGGRKGGWLRRWKGGRVGGRPRPRQPAPRLAGLGPFSLSCCDRPKRGPGPCRPLPCSLPPPSQRAKRAPSEGGSQSRAGGPRARRPRVSSEGPGGGCWRGDGCRRPERAASPRMSSRAAPGRGRPRRTAPGCVDGRVLGGPQRKAGRAGSRKLIRVGQDETPRLGAAAGASQVRRAFAQLRSAGLAVKSQARFHCAGRRGAAGRLARRRRRVTASRSGHWHPWPQLRSPSCSKTKRAP